MKEQYFSPLVYVLGYPIALAIMVAFYATDVLDGGFRAARKLLPAKSAPGRQ